MRRQTFAFSAPVDKAGGLRQFASADGLGDVEVVLIYKGLKGRDQTRTWIPIQQGDGRFQVPTQRVYVGGIEVTAGSLPEEFDKAAIVPSIRGAPIPGKPNVSLAWPPTPFEDIARKFRDMFPY